jgi:hypothetical protein
MHGACNHEERFVRGTLEMALSHSLVTPHFRSLAPRLEPDLGQTASLVVAGDMAAASMAVLRDASATARLAFVEAEGGDELAALLGVRPPRAVVFAANDEAAPRMCGMVRCDPANAGVALLAVADRADEDAFQRALSWGANDVVERRALGSLSATLATLHGAPPVTMLARGIVAHPDARQRTLLAAAASSAGFSVTTASGAKSLRAALTESVAGLVVAAARTSDDPIFDELVHARSGGSLTPWVLSMPQSELGKARSLVAGLPGVAIHDASTPPDGVLFLLNELSHDRFKDVRGSQRVLFATLAHVRGAGLELPTLTYNVSEGGVFVRTLTPVPMGTSVTLETTAPRTNDTLTLEARVAWHRPFGPMGQAVCPPGLGLSIVGGSAADLALWQHACASLARDTGPRIVQETGTLRPWPPSSFR